ncbi:hypothetical protein C8R48DRAFT_730791 [Suillus tomentosus]|nr:hypothetical protein C8R48DRAFT_730791 [Suillus tomentosus]
MATLVHHSLCLDSAIIDVVIPCTNVPVSILDYPSSTSIVLPFSAGLHRYPSRGLSIIEHASPVV